MKKKFNIEGMQCPACSQRLQKSLLKIDGVDDVSVNFTSESLIIDYNDQIVNEDIISQNAEKLGYKLIINKNINFDNNFNKPRIVYYGRLTTISIILFIPLLILGLGQSFLFGFTDESETYDFVRHVFFLQFLLSTAILILGFPIVKNGFLMLFRLHATTDSLLALGAVTSYIYSCIISFRVLYVGYDQLPLLYFTASSAIIVIRIIGYYIEKKISTSNKIEIDSFLELLPETVSVITKTTNDESVKEKKPKTKSKLFSDDDISTDKSVKELNVEDVIWVKSGERIAVDGEVVKGSALVNEILYSGSEGLRRISQGDKILAGVFVADGEVFVRALKSSGDNFLNSMIQMLEEGEHSQPDINRFTDKISSWVIRIIIILAILSGFIWFVTGHDFDFSLGIFLSVLIVGCPVAMGIAVPLSSLFAVRNGAKKGIVIRKISSFEAIQKSTSFVFNQTGTLTKGTLNITDFIITGEFSKERLLFLAASAESPSYHPIGLAITSEALNYNIEVAMPEPFRQIIGEGIEAIVEDVRVDIGNYKLMELLRISDEEINKFLPLYKKLASEGKTVVFIVIDNRIEGIIAMVDEIRANAAIIVDMLEKRGKQTVLLTGDNWSTAKAISEKINIDKIYAEITAVNRASIVRKIQYDNNIVVMVGDGMNDAKAIIQSDAGIVIGTPETIAADVADIIILSNDLRLIDTIVRLSDKTVRNIKENLFFIIIYNLFMLPIAMGLLFLVGINITLDPIIASGVMFISIITVLINSMRLNYFK